MAFAEEGGGYKPHSGNIYAHWVWGAELLAHVHRATWQRATPQAAGGIAARAGSATTRNGLLIRVIARLLS